MERSLSAVAIGKPNDHSILATTARAIELTEEALGQVARIAVEGMHHGLEASAHVEAAERDMRSGLRQLIRAERELRSRPGLAPGRDARPEGIAEVVPGPGADAAA